MSDAKRATNFLVFVVMQVAAHAVTPEPETQLPEGLRTSVGLRSCMALHSASRRTSFPSGVQQARGPPCELCVNAGCRVSGTDVI